MAVLPIGQELDKIAPVIKRVYKHELPDLDVIDKSVIMFDQTLEESIVSERQNAIANMAADIFGENDLAVKMHPRSLIDPYDERIPRYRAKCPFEVLMSTMNMQDKVLISMFSTACMNPKLMLDVEPVVIFTLKLSGMEQFFLLNDDTLASIERFRATYRDQSRIYVPETMEELQAILKDLTGK